MSKHAWLTSDQLGALTCVPIYFPAGAKNYANLLGALRLLTFEDNWEQYGSTTPAQQAEAWTDALWVAGMGGSCMHIGTVFWFANTTPPQGALPCDGGEYSQSEYSELYAVIGDAFGTASAGNFRVPNIQGNSILGEGKSVQGTTRNLAETGGTETHTLIESEIPAHKHTVPNHDHSVHSHLSVLVLGPGEVPVTTPNILGGSTGDWGGDTSSIGNDNAHENMPPFIVLQACIQAK